MLNLDEVTKEIAESCFLPGNKVALVVDEHTESFHLTGETVMSHNGFNDQTRYVYHEGGFILIDHEDACENSIETIALVLPDIQQSPDGKRFIPGKFTDQITKLKRGDYVILEDHIVDVFYVNTTTVGAEHMRQGVNETTVVLSSSTILTAQENVDYVDVTM